MLQKIILGCIVVFLQVDDCYINFGQPSIAFGTNADANSYGRFAYTPPTGYYAWCTKNLKDYG